MHWNTLLQLFVCLYDFHLFSCFFFYFFVMKKNSLIMKSHSFACRIMAANQLVVVNIFCRYVYTRCTHCSIRASSSPKTCDKTKFVHLFRYSYWKWTLSGRVERNTFWWNSGSSLESILMGRVSPLILIISASDVSDFTFVDELNAFGRNSSAFISASESDTWRLSRNSMLASKFSFGGVGVLIARILSM